MGSSRTTREKDCHVTSTTLFSKIQYKSQRTATSSSGHHWTTLAPGSYIATSTTMWSTVWRWSSSLGSHTVGQWDQTRQELFPTRTKLASNSCDSIFVGMWLIL